MRKFGLVAVSAILIAGCEPVDTLGTVSEIPGPRTSNKIPERFTTGVPDSGVELGMGWDSRRGEVVPNRCIHFSPISAPGMEIEMTLSEVSDQSEIMDALNVRASVSVKSITGSGSAKASFAKKSKVKSNETTLLLNAKIENGVLFVGPPAAPAAARRAFPRVNTRPEPEVWPRPAPASDAIVFDPAVKGRLTNKDSFRELCGDYFVAAIYSGAQLVSTISFKSTSKSSKQTITAAIKGEVGGVSASADAKKKHESALSSTSMEMKFMQVGGGRGPIPISRDGLRTKLQALATEAAADPKFHTMELRSYREIAGAEDLIYASNDADYETVADYYWLLSSLYDDIETIREQPGSFAFDTGLPFNQLLVLQDQVLDVRRALYEAIDAYLEGRSPDEALMAKVNFRWFDNPAGEPYRLSLAGIGETGGEPDGDCPTWLNCLADALRAGVPAENPNTLRLLLPLPKGPADTDDLTGLAEHKQAALDWYVRRQSARMCALDPSDNECLSNAQIQALTPLIPPARLTIRSEDESQCLFMPVVRHRDGVVAEPTVRACEGASERSFFALSKDGQLRVHAAGTCLVTTHEGLIEGRCDSELHRGDWRVTEERQIRMLDHCITAAGGKAVAKACSTDDENQRWLVVVDSEQ